MFIFKLLSPVLHTFSIIVAKLVSVIPLILLLGFSFTKLRKEFGWLITGIFAFYIIAMPKMMFYGLQIRMYSWVMFFVTLSFYYAYRITKQINNESSLSIRTFINKNWVYFTIFSLMAVYTHYYGIIACGIIYLMLLFYIILKNRSLIANWIISVAVSVLLCIPWILIFLSKTKWLGLGTNQWSYISIPEEIINSIVSLFSPVPPNIIYKYDLTIFGALALISVVFLLIFYIFKMIRDKKYSFMFICLGGIIVLIGTMSLAGIFSILVTPMLWARYAFPMAGCLWLSVAVLLGKFYSRKMIFIPVLIIFIVLGMTNVGSFISGENDIRATDLEFRHILSQISENDTVLVLGTQRNVDVFNFYSDNIYYYIGYNFSYDGHNFSSYINSKLKKGKLWVFDIGGEWSPETQTFNRLISDNGYKLEEVTQIKIKHDSGVTYQTYSEYPFNIYLIAHNS
ncbi:MAG: hypothetical protein LBV42_05270 [Methanobrevibacter sp.]|jgi:hypothetical protein|nr:hypothetical protein [Methanobrevibacter sp.]